MEQYYTMSLDGDWQIHLTATQTLDELRLDHRAPQTDRFLALRRLSRYQ